MVTKQGCECTFISYYIVWFFMINFRNELLYYKRLATMFFFIFLSNKYLIYVIFLSRSVSPEVVAVLVLLSSTRVLLKSAKWKRVLQQQKQVYVPVTTSSLSMATTYQSHSPQGQLRSSSMYFFVFACMLKGNFANKLEGPSLMRHIYKICFSKIEEIRIYVKKKNRHQNNAMNS